MPPDAAELVARVYGQAETILEYGSGGSTVLAAELPDKHITTVESDRSWVRRMCVQHFDHCFSLRHRPRESRQ